MFTYDPGFHVDRQLHVEDHVHRRRRGRAAVSRLPDRAARDAVRLPGGLLPAAARRAAERRAEGKSSITPSRATRWCTSRLARFYTGFRRDSHPMAVLVGTVGALSAFYHDSLDINNPAHREISAFRLIAKMPTIVAMAYKYSVGQPFVYPRNDLGYAANFMRMMFAVPAEEYRVERGAGARARPHLHPARRSRAERVDVDRARGRLVRREPVRVHRRRHRLPVGPGARRRERSVPEHARRDRRRRRASASSSSAPRTRTTASS